MNHRNSKFTAGTAVAVVLATALSSESTSAAPIGIEVETIATLAAYGLDPATGFFQNGGQVVPGDPALIGAGPSITQLPPGSDVQSSVVFGLGSNDADYMNATTLQTWESGNDLAYEAFFSSGRQNNYDYATQTLHYFTITNNSGAQQFLTYDFELTDMFAEFRYAYANDTGNPFDNRDLEGAAGVRLWMELRRLGEDGALFEAESELWAYFLDDSPTYSFDATNITIAGVTPLSPSSQVIGYNIQLADVVQSIDLGLFAPDASQTFLTTFELEVIQGTFEIGIEAGAVDPGRIPDRINVTGGGTPSLIPLPATAFQLLAGLLSLGALRRRRNPESPRS